MKNQPAMRENLSKEANSFLVSSEMSEQQINSCLLNLRGCSDPYLIPAMYAQYCTLTSLFYVPKPTAKPGHKVETL